VPQTKFTPEFVIFETVDNKYDRTVLQCDHCEKNPATLIYCVESAHAGQRTSTMGRCCVPCSTRILTDFTERTCPSRMAPSSEHLPTRSAVRLVN
jgi:hypothetical protein